MSLWEQFQIGSLAFAITAGVAGAVCLPVYWKYRGRRLLPLQRIRPAHWTGREVWFAFAFLIMVPSIATSLLAGIGFFPVIFDEPPPEIRQALWASPLILLLALASLSGVLFLVSGTRLSHLGLSLTRLPQNCLLGYFSFLALTPLVLGLHLLIRLLFQTFFDTGFEVHWLEKLGQGELMTAEWVLLFFEAIVLAPVMEELYFRGLIQGWVQSADFAGQAGTWRHAGVAIGLPALLWSASHFGVWPDPIPLFFLGIGLGYLTYRTQNLVPALVVHALFNTVACLGLLLP